VKRSKGKKRRRVIPLNPEGLAIVQRLVLKHGDGPIFRTRRGEAYSPSGLRSAFRRIGKKLGINVSPYDIRHTFATNSIKRGVDLISLSEIMGHTDLTMLKKNYSHLLMAGNRTHGQEVRTHRGDASLYCVIGTQTRFDSRNDHRSHG